MAHVYVGKTTSTHESIDRSMNKAERPSIEDAYILAHARAAVLINEVKDIIQDMPAPETDQRFNWGHVGSLGYICEQLENIKQSFRATED